jgi:hypothetical protein
MAEFVVEGWRLYSPHSKTAETIEEAVEMSRDAIRYNEWAPKIVKRVSGEIVLDEQALSDAIRALPDD